jgi:hypothetical protein
MVKKPNCKFANEETTFNSTEDFDIDGDGQIHSRKGIWAKPYPGPICCKFQTADEQFKELRGFCFCDLNKEKECYYFEKRKDGDKK